MKSYRCSIVCLCLIFLGLTSCGQEKISPLESPPSLTVSGQEASRGSYEWDRIDSLGSGTGTSAAGVHPLDRLDSIPAVVLPEDGRLPLSWQAAPDQVSAYYWPSQYLGQAATPEIDGAVIEAEILEDGLILPPEALPCVVEIYARWEEGTLKQCSGQSSYCIQVLPER